MLLLLCLRIVIVLLRALVLIVVPLPRDRLCGGRIIYFVVLLLFVPARPAPPGSSTRFRELCASAARVAAHHQLSLSPLFGRFSLRRPRVVFIGQRSARRLDALFVLRFVAIPARLCALQHQPRRRLGRLGRLIATRNHRRRGSLHLLVGLRALAVQTPTKLVSRVKSSRELSAAPMHLHLHLCLALMLAMKQMTVRVLILTGHRCIGHGRLRQ